MSVLVKFLGGSQAGSEILLPPGEYVLGGDDAADLALADAAVRPRHALLTIGDGLWEVEAVEDAEIRVNGARIRGKTSISSYQVLSLGGTHLALGPDGPWKKLPAIPPSVPEQAYAGGDSSAGAAVSEEGAAANPAASAAPPGKANGAIAVKGAEDAAGKTPPGAGSGGGGRWRRGLLLAALAAIAGAAAYYAIHVYMPLPLPTGDPGGRLAEMARDRLVAGDVPATMEEHGSLPPGMVAVKPAQAGTVKLAGLLPTEAERRRVVAMTGLPAEELEDGLITAEGEIRALAAEMRRSFPGIDLSFPGGGYTALLAGVADTASEAGDMYRAARERLDARIGVRRRVWHWPDVAQEAEREAERLGIAGAHFIRENGAVRLEAEQPPSPDLLRRLAAAVNERMGKAVAAFLAPALDPERPAGPPVAEEPPPPAPPPEPEEPQPEPVEPEPESRPDVLDLRDFWSVMTVEQDGFRDQMNRRWRIGDVLGDGLKLVASWKDGMVFQRGDETLFVRPGGTVFDESGMR